MRDGGIVQVVGCRGNSRVAQNGPSGTQVPTI